MKREEIQEILSTERVIFENVFPSAKEISWDTSLNEGFGGYTDRYIYACWLGWSTRAISEGVRPIESMQKNSQVENLLLRDALGSLEGYRRHLNDIQPCDAEQAIIKYFAGTASILSEYNAGLGTTPGMWEMLSDILAEHEEKLPEALNTAIYRLRDKRAFVGRK
jgi:hypothetical protein